MADTPTNSVQAQGVGGVPGGEHERLRPGLPDRGGAPDVHRPVEHVGDAPRPDGGQRWRAGHLLLVERVERAGRWHQRHPPDRGDGRRVAPEHVPHRSADELPRQRDGERRLRHDVCRARGVHPAAAGIDDAVGFVRRDGLCLWRAGDHRAGIRRRSPQRWCGRRWERDFLGRFRCHLHECGRQLLHGHGHAGTGVPLGGGARRARAPRR